MFNLFKKKKTKKPEKEGGLEASTIDTVKKLISNVIEDLDKKRIQPETELEHLGLDSIKFLNLLLAFEDELEMELEDIVEKIDLSIINTVQDIVDVVDDLKTSQY